MLHPSWGTNGLPCRHVLSVLREKNRPFGERDIHPRWLTVHQMGTLGANQAWTGWPTGAWWIQRAVTDLVIDAEVSNTRVWPDCRRDRHGQHGLGYWISRQRGVYRSQRPNVVDRAVDAADKVLVQDDSGATKPGCLS